MTRQRSVFDVVGPVMIGPSSSHTAGACRMGAIARSLFGATPSKAHILLHGSFASTGHGHGTDLALVAGLLGMQPDDARISNAFELAREAGLAFDFAKIDLGDAHPNSAVFELSDSRGREIRVQGCSMGGGDVVITRVDGYEVELTGELPVLVISHMDRPGEIAAVTGVLAASNVNIASMQVSRERKGAHALMLIETDAQVDQPTADKIAQQSGVVSVRRVPAV